MRRFRTGEWVVRVAARVTSDTAPWSLGNIKRQCESMNKVCKNSGRKLELVFMQGTYIICVVVSCAKCDVIWTTGYLNCDMCFYVVCRVRNSLSMRPIKNERLNPG